MGMCVRVGHCMRPSYLIRRVDIAHGMHAHLGPVTYSVDADGIFSLTAKETSAGKHNSFANRRNSLVSTIRLPIGDIHW